MHPPTRTPSDSAIPSDDRGWTLTEVVVAIALSGTLILSLITGVHTLVRTSSISRDQAKVEAVLGGAADELAEAGWQSCPVETGAYEAVVDSAAARVEWAPSAVRVESIEYWDISANAWSPTNPFAASGSCQMVPTIAAASRMQRVTVAASSPGGGHTRTLQVVVAEIKFLDEQDA